MHRTVLIAAVTAGLIVAEGCSSAQRTARPARDRNVLTAAELASMPGETLYEGIQRLRPEFLRGRGQLSIEDPSGSLPVVYLDGMRVGGLDVLRTIRVAEVHEVRFYSAADATTRYGTGHPGGVIAVMTRRGGS